MEASPEQVAATGAGPGGWGRDPIDADDGYRPAGSAGRQVPAWTLEKARTYSVAAYRSNPMARAIVDTYTSFAVGDHGVSYQCTNPEVRAVVEEFWTDPRNNVARLQELWLRDHMLTGESVLELMSGPVSGVVRFSPIDPAAVEDVSLHRGNPLWPAELLVRVGASDAEVFTVAGVDDATGLRDGQVQFWSSWKALMTDRRGFPFLGPVLDWLDAYDNVLSNLIDRTALARHLVYDVTVTGSDTDVKKYVADRGGTALPRSGSMEVHNEAVVIKPMTVQTGAEEDSVAAKSVLTLTAAGSGLSKVWLAEPEDANRATALTMAEPVRRRVGGVQQMWLANQTELVRFVVDRAVAAKRLRPTVTAADPRTGKEFEVPAAQCVIVTGPEVAAADAQFTAAVLLNLSTGLEQMVASGVLSREAAKVAAKKAWEQYVGVPYTSDLDSPDANPDDVATAVDDAGAASKLHKILSGPKRVGPVSA